MHQVFWKFCALAALLTLMLVGCSKSSDNNLTSEPKNPKEAAVQVEKVFDQAPPEIKQNAESAAQAMRGSDYEAAIENLHAIRKGQSLTMEQGLAVQRAMATLEMDLMRRVEAGDEKAKKAYELLRERNRN